MLEKKVIAERLAKAQLNAIGNDQSQEITEKIVGPELNESSSFETLLRSACLGWERDKWTKSDFISVLVNFHIILNNKQQREGLDKDQQAILEQFNDYFPNEGFKDLSEDKLTSYVNDNGKTLNKIVSRILKILDGDDLLANNCKDWSTGKMGAKEFVLLLIEYREFYSESEQKRELDERHHRILRELNKYLGKEAKEFTEVQLQTLVRAENSKLNEVVRAIMEIMHVDDWLNNYCQKWNNAEIDKKQFTEVLLELCHCFIKAKNLRGLSERYEKILEVLTQYFEKENKKSNEGQLQPLLEGVEKVKLFAIGYEIMKILSEDAELRLNLINRMSAINLAIVEAEKVAQANKAAVNARRFAHIHAGDGALAGVQSVSALIAEGIDSEIAAHTQAEIELIHVKEAIKAFRKAEKNRDNNPTAAWVSLATAEAALKAADTARASFFVALNKVDSALKEIEARKIQNAAGSAVALEQRDADVKLRAAEQAAKNQVELAKVGVESAKKSFAELEKNIKAMAKLLEDAKENAFTMVQCRLLSTSLESSRTIESQAKQKLGKMILSITQAEAALSTGDTHAAVNHAQASSETGKLLTKDVQTVVSTLDTMKSVFANTKANLAIKSPDHKGAANSAKPLTHSKAGEAASNGTGLSFEANDIAQARRTVRTWTHS